VREYRGNPSVMDFTPGGQPRNDTRRRLPTIFNRNTDPGKLHPLSTPSRPETTGFRPTLESQHRQPTISKEMPSSNQQPREHGLKHFPRYETPHISSANPFREYRFQPIDGLGVSLNGDMPSDGGRHNGRPVSRTWTSTSSSRDVDASSGRATQFPPTSGQIMRSTERSNYENSKSKAKPPLHAGLNSLSFVEVPYSTKNQPLSSPRHTAATNSTVQNPWFHRSAAIPHFSEQSSSTAYTSGWNTRVPTRATSISRPSGVKNGQSREFPNGHRNFYSDHLKSHKRVTMPPVGPYSLGMRSSRSRRTPPLYLSR
jgi:hypothetical protein